MTEKHQKVAFIESFIKIGNGDYKWNDYRELIMCKDCKHGYTLTDSAFVTCGCRFHDGQKHEADWFCADGQRKDSEKE